MQDASPKRYAALISYNHRDHDHARRLHRALETYRLPARLARELGRPRALGTFFLDRAELSSSPDLSAAVADAIARSDHLIVVCSPNSAASRWVNEEIRAFAKPERTLCLVVGGDPAQRDGPTSPYPPALFDGGRTTEPLAADLRPGADPPREARLKLIAGMLGIGFDRLRQREAARRQQHLAVLATGLALLALTLGALAITATLARREAERQRAVAERTTDFLKSLFRVSDPSEARGAQVTAREILDRGARTVATELVGEPAVRADVTMTLAEVHASLGLFRDARRLTREAAALPGGEVAERAALVAGEFALAAGDFRGALASFDSALASRPEDALRARAQIGRGDALSALERFAEADVALLAARDTSATRTPPDRAGMTLALESRAENRYWAGDLAAAARLYRAAIAERTAQGGRLHPGVVDALNALGAIAADGGRRDEAARLYAQALPLQRAMLGPRHPQVGGALNNLARIHLETGDPARALPMLIEARAIIEAEAGDRSDILAFVLANLALAQAGTGDAATARLNFEAALKVADAHRHRMLGPILADLADMDCAGGAPQAGLARLEAAARHTAADYPGVAWRAAVVENVRAACLAAAGRRAEARALFAASEPAIRAAWKPGELFAAAAARRRRAASL